MRSAQLSVIESCSSTSSVIENSRKWHDFVGPCAHRGQFESRQLPGEGKHTWMLLGCEYLKLDDGSIWQVVKLYIFISLSSCVK